ASFTPAWQWTVSSPADGQAGSPSGGTGDSSPAAAPESDGSPFSFSFLLSPLFDFHHATTNVDKFLAFVGVTDLPLPLSENMEEPKGPTELPPPPPVVPPNVIPLRVNPSPARVPMARKGTGSVGQPCTVFANHVHVKLPTDMEGSFFHYSVELSIVSDDSRPVVNKSLGRKIVDNVQQLYGSELSSKKFAYDGEKGLYTYGELPKNTMNFTVLLEESNYRRCEKGNGNDSPGEGERKKMKRPGRSRKFEVEISYAAKIPLRQIEAVLRGQESGEDVLRVLDIILRQHAAKRGCLLVRQSFFLDDRRSFVDIGEGAVACRGFHTSFRPTQSGLSLNIDVSTTVLLKPGPVIDFLIENQNVKGPSQIDWPKAKRLLKNLRIKTTHNGMEFKIIGLTERYCNEEIFQLRVKVVDNAVDYETVAISVYDYFVKEKHIQLKYSANLPCLIVGRLKHPAYLPLELCELVSLQRYTKALSPHQRASLVERSRQKPQERVRSLIDAMKVNQYHENPLFSACGINFVKEFTQIQGRILPPPKLVFGNGESVMPRNGRWKIDQMQMLQPAKIKNWAIVNFSARCDTRHLAGELISTAKNKGIIIAQPAVIVEENPKNLNASARGRVEKMFEDLQSKLVDRPEFLLCVISERKHSCIYGQWKRKSLVQFGVPTQCVAPPQRISNLYLTNVLLKINAKLGGINSLLAIEDRPSIPIISSSPTIIFGIDVSHGSPGQSDVPSIAAVMFFPKCNICSNSVVSSRSWPLFSRYRASVRSQSPKVEMVDSLFKPSADGKTDKGIIRELLLDFYQTSRKMKPQNMIIFRDGVSESQFSQVLNIELEQIIQACDLLERGYRPKITVIIAQKNHNTRLFQNSHDNVLPGSEACYRLLLFPGTVIDTRICHPRYFDFYMCAHAGIIGTSRPTHYHVLMDEIGFSVDDIQRLVHSLSYVLQRSTTAISIAAPIRYAHLAAEHMSHFLQSDGDSPGTPSSKSSDADVTVPCSIPIPQMPFLHDDVSSSMFFC
ncbi:argonaute 4B protein, partial [Nymphaea thermarum]